jgi:hypothetical protein
MSQKTELFITTAVRTLDPAVANRFADVQISLLIPEA